MFFSKNIFTIIVISAISFPAFAIIGGRDITNYDQFSLSRSTVALQLKFYKVDGTVGFRKGTGILLKDNIVLTAGHNVFYQQHPGDIEVIFHERPCWGENTCKELRIVAKEKIVHPDFVNNYPNPPENDIAIIKLLAKAPSGFLPVKLSTDTTHQSPYFLYGYGQSTDTFETVPLSDFRLRELIYFAPERINIGKFTKFILPQITHAFCAGDSGSGLIAFSNGVPEIIGIAIHHGPGGGCLSSGYFTDLKYFRNWIEKTLRSLGSQVVPLELHN